MSEPAIRNTAFIFEAGLYYAQSTNLGAIILRLSISVDWISLCNNYSFTVCLVHQPNDLDDSRQRTVEGIGRRDPRRAVILEMQR